MQILHTPLWAFGSGPSKSWSNIRWSDRVVNLPMPSRKRGRVRFWIRCCCSGCNAWRQHGRECFCIRHCCCVFPCRKFPIACATWPRWAMSLWQCGRVCCRCCRRVFPLLWHLLRQPRRISLFISCFSHMWLLHCRWRVTESKPKWITEMWWRSCRFLDAWWCSWWCSQSGRLAPWCFLIFFGRWSVKSKQKRVRKEYGKICSCSLTSKRSNQLYYKLFSCLHVHVYITKHFDRKKLKREKTRSVLY